MSDTTTSTLAAALWDFDGTLADTEPLWIAAEYDLIDKLGGTWSQEHAEQFPSVPMQYTSLQLARILPQFSHEDSCHN